MVVVLLINQRHYNKRLQKLLTSNFATIKIEKMYELTYCQMCNFV